MRFDPERPVGAAPAFVFQLDDGAMHVHTSAGHTLYPAGTAHNSELAYTLPGRSYQAATYVVPEHEYMVSVLTTPPLPTAPLGPVYAPGVCLVTQAGSVSPFFGLGAHESQRLSVSSVFAPQMFGITDLSSLAGQGLSINQISQVQVC